MKHHYQTLELPFNASPRKIKEQYRKLAKRYHPDRVTNPADKANFAEKFREINQAYEALSEIVQRARLSPKERKLDFLYQKGNVLVEQKEWAGALTVFNEIVAIDPAYRDAFSRLRNARRKHKQLAVLYAEAEALFQQQAWAQATAGFGEILRLAPNYRDAARKYRKAQREQLTEDFTNHR